MWWRGGIGGTVPGTRSARFPPRCARTGIRIGGRTPSVAARIADENRMDGTVTRGRLPGPAIEGSHVLDAGGDATMLLARVDDGDSLLVAGLVPAPSLRVALTPE